MARLVKSVAQRTSNFEDIDKHYAYMIWLAEKEFNVGKIESDFPAMKFWNLFDKDNIEKYNNDTKSGGNVDDKGVPKTFG